MIALIQRVLSAQVVLEKVTIGEIGLGLLIFLGIEQGDNEHKAQRLSERVLGYRIFSDTNDKMNLNVKQVNGSLLVVSQFTLVADTQQGMRPCFSRGAKPVDAQRLYKYFVAQCLASEVKTETGQFAANMKVSLVNDGPVTFLLKT